MKPALTTARRFGPSIFVAAHVVAVVALYGAALAVGGGISPAPFPPLSIAAAPTAATPSAARVTLPARGVVPVSSAPAPAWHEVEPAWAEAARKIDAAGRNE
jgi:hypothetical protein